MKNCCYPIYIALFCLLLPCLTAQAQPKSFDEFRTEGMEKHDGVLPVYTAGSEIYLEIPQKLLGREIEIRAQIDRGFDLLNRPAKGLGVVRLTAPDTEHLCLQQPFYAERMLDKDSPNFAAFSLSNVQPEGRSYPIEAYSPGRGILIRITDELLSGDEWFRYNYNGIRSQVPDLSKLLRIHPFDEGVSFTVRRYHEAEAERYMYSNNAVILPSGSMPLEVTCTVRLLPQKKDAIRLADKRIPFQCLTFKDYSQNPYNVAEDSLILRWDLSEPLCFYVDSLFPEPYFKAVEKGITAWNTAFRKAGIRQALQVRRAGRIVAGEQRAFVSYDLKQPGIRTDITCHPRTGEILSCRLNVGHGFLPELMEDYLLTCGATDGRIAADPSSEAVEMELFQSEITRATARLLGLHRCLSEQPCGAPLTVGAADEQAIRFGYHPFGGGMDCYAEREALRRWLRSSSAQPVTTAGADSAEAMAGRIKDLQTVVGRLDKILAEKGNPPREGALTALYRKAIRRYAACLRTLAAPIGTSAPAARQRRAVELLGQCLFRPEAAMESPYLKANLLATEAEWLYPELKPLFTRLFSAETVETLRLQAAVEGDAAYTDTAFFRDFCEELFCGFDVSKPVGYRQMDLQLMAVEAWTNAAASGSGTAALRLKAGLSALYDRLARFCESSAPGETRELYTLLMQRIKARIR